MLRVVIKFIILLVCVVPQLAVAATRDVCDSCAFTKITEAILASHNGDLIRIASGTYSGYDNDTSFGSGYPSLSIAGGYDVGFASRNGETILSGVGLQLNPYFVGSVAFDGLTFSGGTSIYVASTAASLSVTNCKFDNPSGAAINVAPYYPLPEYPWADRRQRASTTFTFLNNQIVANPTAGALDIYLYTDGAWTATTRIEGNSVSGATQEYASGINYYSNGTNDSVVIRNNHIFGNKTGLVMQLVGSNGYAEVAYNRVHDNLQYAMRLTNAPNIDGRYLVHHNRIYSHPMYGVTFSTPGRAAFYNNVFFANQWVGLKFYGASGSPRIVNNIFSEHPHRSLEITAYEAGWGNARIIPSALRYNNFFNTTPANLFFHESLPPAYSYYSEVPGDWNDINQFSWSDGNYSEDPHFVHPGAGDFTLEADSFCIDEGDPLESFDNEPLPNGARINQGINGNTESSEATPAMINLSNLVGAQVGENLRFDFDLSTELSAVWVLAEYLGGSGWTAISPSELSGSDYVVGYKAGRVWTGAGRRLVWNGASSALDGLSQSNFKVRLTVFHGERSQRMESAPFTITYAAPSVTVTSPTLNNFIPADGTPFMATVSGFRVAPTVVRFEYKREGAVSFLTLSSDSGVPYLADWSGVRLESGARYAFRATALDADGNPHSSSEVLVTVCGETLSAVSAAHQAQATDAEISVSSNSSCGWTATTASSWISILSGSPSVGPGTVRYRVEGNSGGARTGTIVIGNRSIDISQAAPSRVTISIVKSGSGKGRIISDGQTVVCAENCTATSFSVGVGSQVSLAAIAPAGSKLSNWAGADCSSSEATCSFTALTDQTITVGFNSLPPF